LIMKKTEPKYRVGDFVKAKFVHEISDSSVLDFGGIVVDMRWEQNDWEYKIVLADAIFGEIANFTVTVKEKDLGIDDDAQ